MSVQNFNELLENDNYQFFPESVPFNNQSPHIQFNENYIGLDDNCLSQQFSDPQQIQQKTDPQTLSRPDSQISSINTKKSGSDIKPPKISSKIRNNLSRNYYETILREIRKQDEKEQEPEQRELDEKKKKIGNKNFQTRIVSMIISAANNKDSTPNIMVQQLADYFNQKKDQFFCDYLKYILLKAKRQEKDLYENEYVTFAVNQILKKVKKYQSELDKGIVGVSKRSRLMFVQNSVKNKKFY